MKFYLFGGDFHLLDKMYDSKFDGTLFLYNSATREYFTEIAINAFRIKKDFKCMVAIRPYTISPQYLAMIHRSIYNHIGNILQINLISGWVKPEEAPYNSFVGDINDSSGHVDRSEYLIKYLRVINTLKNNLSNSIEKNVPDIYVSTTNKFIFDAASEYQNKIILPYGLYKRGSFYSDTNAGLAKFNLADKKVMISISLIIRKTQEEIDGIKQAEGQNDLLVGTPETVVQELRRLKNEGIEGVLFYAWEDEKDRLFEFLKKYKENI